LLDRGNLRADADGHGRRGLRGGGHDIREIDAARLEAVGFRVGDVVADDAKIGLGVLQAGEEV
jgi:hypothetical protein